MNSNLSPQSDNAIITQFENLVLAERKTTGEIIALIQEIDHRRLYIKLGHTSLFAYLTNGLGYTPASAQRRIESARLMNSLPEIKQGLQSGELNLMQLSIASQAFRLKKKMGVPITTAEKTRLLGELKQKDLPTTEKLLAEALNLPPKNYEKIRQQRDESTRLEITLTNEQMEALRRVKEIVSHQLPNPSWAELITLLAEKFIAQKDPRTRPQTRRPAASILGVGSSRSTNKRTHLPAHLRRLIHKRDESCRWKDGHTQKLCASKFQLEVDHIKPVWAGGQNRPDNLQLLCAIHNRWKYELDPRHPAFARSDPGTAASGQASGITSETSPH